MCVIMCVMVRTNVPDIRSSSYIYMPRVSIRSGMLRGYDTVLTGICVFYLSSTMYQSYAAAHEV